VVDAWGSLPIPRSSLHPRGVRRASDYPASVRPTVRTCSRKADPSASVWLVLALAAAVLGRREKCNPDVTGMPPRASTRLAIMPAGLLPCDAGRYRRCHRTDLNHDVEGKGRTTGGLLFVKGLYEKSWGTAHSQPRHQFGHLFIIRISSMDRSPRHDSALVWWLALFTCAGSFISSSQNVHIGLVALR